MNLNEWSLLSEERQHALIVQWHKDGQWENYYSMASEAAGVLKDSLKSVPGITNVTVGRGRTLYFHERTTQISESVLCVCTNLPEYSKLEQVPSRICGFGVKQLNLGDKRDAFIKTFTFLLRELRGWNESDSLKWVNETSCEPLAESLVGGHLGLAVYSKGPVTLAISTLLNQETERSIKAAGNDPIAVRNEILSVIRDAIKQAGSIDFEHPDKVQNLDWTAVGKRINELIETASRGCATG